MPKLPAGWVETDVSFPTVFGAVHGTFTHPAGTRSVPATLIIGGSGPTDRDGNSALGLKSMNTLLTMSRWLAADGVATLRYDKPGSGKTGMGKSNLKRPVEYRDYLLMNRQALAFLAARKDVQRDRISILGHSEGGLYALDIATSKPAASDGVRAVPVHSIASIQGLSTRLLDVMRRQLNNGLAMAIAAGQVPKSQAAPYRKAITDAITAIRAGKPLPKNLPKDLAGIFSPRGASFLRTEDAIRPTALAAKLPSGLPVLLSCSDADIQVSCTEVAPLAAVAKRADAAVDFVRLKGVAHTLKVDPSKTTVKYDADLPFSPVLRAAISRWAKQ